LLGRADLLILFNEAAPNLSIRKGIYALLKILLNNQPSLGIRESLEKYRRR